MASNAADWSDDKGSEEEPIDVVAEVQAAILAAHHDESDEIAEGLEAQADVDLR